MDQPTITRGVTVHRPLSIVRRGGPHLRHCVRGEAVAALFHIGPSGQQGPDPLGDLAGYRISYGRMSGIYDYEIDLSNPGIVTYVVENLVPGDWYFVLTAYDSSGLESAPSEEADFKVR